MRVRVVGENLIERVALALNLAPEPVAESLWGPAVSAVLITGIRTGIIERLGEKPESAAVLASTLDLAPEPTRLLLECLTAQRHLKRHGDRYELTARARKWLDPKQPLSIAGFISSHQDYWPWWTALPDVVRTGKHFEMHSLDPNNPYWEPYIRGQCELARLSAPEVAGALRFDNPPNRLVDVAGAHGWFSAELCRKYPGATATVIDLEGSARVGRRIIAEAEMSDRVTHVAGDALTADLGGPYDAALCFNLIHHLTPDQIRALFRRIHEVLLPNGTLAVLDLFAPPEGRQPDGGSMLGLFFYLQSGTETYSEEQLAGWLNEAGFSQPRRIGIRRIPVQALYQTRRAD